MFLALLTLGGCQIFQDEIAVKGGAGSGDSKFADGGKSSAKRVPASTSDAVWVLPASDTELRGAIEAAYHHVLSDATGPHAGTSSLQGKDLKAVLMRVLNPSNKMDISAPELLEFNAQLSTFSTRQGFGGDGDSPLPLPLLQQYSGLKFLREVASKVSRIRAVQKQEDYLKHAKILKDEV